ncbi:MAG: hypothetical protein ACRDOM_06470, partial [Nocardioides sp.]
MRQVAVGAGLLLVAVLGAGCGEERGSGVVTPPARPSMSTPSTADRVSEREFCAVYARGRETFDIDGKGVQSTRVMKSWAGEMQALGTRDLL